MSCPDELCTGRLYDTHSPHLFIRLTGQPLIAATRFEQQALRCSRCQHRYVAPLPDSVVPQKYDPTADVAMALSRYGAGLPFYRLARMQRVWGVPVPESVQFERCERVADALLPIFLYLRTQAAQCQTIYADDTRVKILSLMKENEMLPEGARRGMQTTGMVAQVGARRIVLYQSGRLHAGEDVEELLRLRPQALSPPVQMGDALSNNWTGEFSRIVAKCLAHARRQFIEIEAAFPSECKRVLDTLSEVYQTEAATHAMTAEERLLYHQRHSGPVMQDLHDWMTKQFSERAVEPNGALGRALRYMQTHWDGLTRFLSEQDAPLDNNVVERVLKRAVLVRKNSLFYRTEHGAAVADVILSLIETCQQNGVSAWDYLLAVVRNERVVRKNPQEWLPWNYAVEELEERAA